MALNVQLSPKPGFCIKTSTLNAGIILPDKKDTNVLELEPKTTPIPQGMKVFVNIAWDSNVPSPPEASEDAIQRAMKGQDPEWDQASGSPPTGWYVPVVIAGKPSLVFDCVYNVTIKSRTLRDPEFKVFLVELALQRIESQSGLLLSRTIGTPNILCKGKLTPRTVTIPKSLFTNPSEIPNQKGKQKEVSHFDIGASPTPQTPNTAKKSLIEVLPEKNPADQFPANTASSTANGKEKEKDAALPKLRGILKKGGPSASSLPSTNPPPQPVDPDRPLQWTWAKEDSTGKLRIDVAVPGLVNFPFTLASSVDLFSTTQHRQTPTLAQESTLDIAPRSILLKIPNHKTLNVDLALSDAEITARIATTYKSALSKDPTSATLQDQKSEETSSTLQLKRQRDFDVDAADAEWKIGSGILRLWV
ncbi:hypothetical protein CVT24_002235 [Panaeolus cyanescens]|uniref:PIH1 N-terminal domain-containing protein n=1 Tax=Panaeolus cyanescens TaxID=181874 RepID=A0A409YIN3_9AGAR|nr:hypothetical protein CVT24_002235 [Panaeolus cyanescens]